MEIKRKEQNAIKRLLSDKVKTGDRFPVQIIHSSLYVYVEAKNLELYALTKTQIVNPPFERDFKVFKFLKPTIVQKEKEMYLSIYNNDSAIIIDSERLDAMIEEGLVTVRLKHRELFD